MHLTLRRRTVRRAATFAAILSAILALASVLVAGSAVVSSAATGSVYYVAPGGSDSAAGTKAAPWATIAHAQSVVKAGDTEPFSSSGLLTGLQYVDGLGELAGAPGAAAELA
jgi:hypothetical protein